MSDLVWVAVHTPVGLEAREGKFDTEQAAQDFLADSTGEALRFVEAPSQTVSYRRMSKPRKGGSAQYWCQ